MAADLNYSNPAAAARVQQGLEAWWSGPAGRRVLREIIRELDKDGGRGRTRD